jgi:hypothetical protein
VYIESQYSMTKYNENGQPRMLRNKWNLFYHLPNNSDWSLNSYVPVMENIENADSILLLNEKISDIVVKNCMLFVMKQGITPLWEDPENRNGGCFSYKILNKHVYDIWKQLFFLICGESLFTDKDYNDNVNGITISPKKNFCIIKIWMKTTTHQDIKKVSHIPNLIANECIFKAHAPEY